ncbi:MAG: helix-turn-helix transcriptional regulator [Ruminococcus flavefaciens]|nr:helix-turn-helix transcriptional regulator [Ruminococcus flavefaciens]
MDTETCAAWCRSLAKAYSTGVRIYQDGEPGYYYSVYHLYPDPVEPYIRQILDSGAEAGVITTPSYQFYGFLAVEPGLMVILGPTRPLQDSGRARNELMALLSIPQKDREGYARALCSAPVISADRLAWLLAALVTALKGSAFPVEQVWMDIRPESSQEAVQTSHVRQRANLADDVDKRELVRQSYDWERMVTSYIAEGRPERLRELFSAPPRVAAGRMAQDGLRQVKNTGICTAAISARAAIAGGLDAQEAFQMSDLYIQKLELMGRAAAVERLIQEMVVDFAQQVARLRQPSGGGSRFFRLCAHYVSQNIFSPIRAEDMAKALGYTRAYLRTRFKQEAGISLSQYVQREKAAEAKRLLRFTDLELSAVAALLGFSSQSHFQTVFKQVTGDTPMAYRRNMRGT